MLDRADWKTAPPLWTRGLAGDVALDRPALLRFDSDDFMDRFQDRLAEDEPDLGDLVAKYETWESVGAGLDGTPATEVLKLYQPTHGRFYLVTASLVCARYGLPDKAIHAADDEKVSFVLRRLEPTNSDVDLDDPSTYREFAWIGGADGRWESANGALVEGEERLPVFPVSYTVAGRRRRLLAGLVPVAAREKYENAVVPGELPTATTADPLGLLIDERLESLERGIAGLQALAGLGTVPSVQTADDETVDLFREALFFALVDLADFIRVHLPNVWAAAPATVAETDVQTLLDLPFDSATGMSWHAALLEADASAGLVLADLVDPPAPVTAADPAAVAGAIAPLGIATIDGDGFAISPVETLLFETVVAAVPDVQASNGSGDVDEGTEPGVPATEASFTEGAVYIAKYVYERPNCPPSKRVQLSKPTETFRLAHFYDPAAPYRETRIVMPVDTSIEGLRKFPNAVKVAISAQLRKQMDRVQDIKLGALDDGDIPDETQMDLGMVCSLSIPIITICALILLMIIVSLLNIVFFWKPLFKICKPKAG